MSKAKRVMKHILNRIAFRLFALDIIRGFLLKRLEPVTVDHLYQGIKEGAHVWDVTDLKLKHRGQFWARKAAKAGYLRDELTTDLVLRWLDEDRPDLASLIRHMPKKQGLEWLAKEVNDIKHKLWPET